MHNSNVQDHSDKEFDKMKIFDIYFTNNNVNEVLENFKLI